MRTTLIAFAVVSVLALPQAASAQQSLGHASPRHESAAEVVDQLRGSCASLRLTPEQDAALTSLSARLHAERGHLRYTGRDRVPGHFSPVFERVKTSAEEALNSALAILQPDQKDSAIAVLGRAPSSTLTTC